jgi:DNA-binding LacI/PurR family transcriptional regulator
MKVTRADVAKKAGVSPATVSCVLNNSRSVSRETRLKVMKAVEELRYKPDMIARSMVTNETRQLAVVVNNIENPFFGEIVSGFENAALENNYLVSICTGLYNLNEYFDNFVSRRIDGIYVAALPHKFRMEKIYSLVDTGIKVLVSGNADANLKKVSSIEDDHMDGMFKAVSHLVDLGHRNIAFLNGLGIEQKCDNKWEGYLKAIDRFGLPCGDSLLINGSYPYGTECKDGYNLIRKLIKSGKPFSAVICTNDLMAFGAIAALKDAGFSIPDDVSVVGFDGIKIGDFMDPPLTTVAMQCFQFGQKAFQLLHNNLKHGNTGFYLNKMELIIRKSTGPCKRG